MAPKATAPTDGAETETDATPPDLYGVIRTGAVFAGEVVTEVVIVTASGRRQRLQLPTPGERGGLTRSKRKIMDVLKASDQPLTRLVVAHRCGLEDATGRFGRNVRELLGAGLIYSNGDDITDDPGKFE